MSYNRWLMLAVLFFAPFCYLFGMQAAPPIIPEISREFNLTHTAAAGLMWYVALPAIVLSVPGGFLADRFGNKKLSVIGIALVALSTSLSALSPSYGFLLVSRAILGIGGALVFTAAPPMVFQWFSGKELALAMGIWATNMPLATTISFNLLSRAETAYGWRYGFGIAALLTGIMLIVFILFAKERKKTVYQGFSLAAVKNLSMWNLALIFSLFSMAMIGLTTWGKTLFMEYKGLPPIQADFLAGLIMILALSTPITGYIAGRIKRPRLLIMLSLAGVAVCLYFIPGVTGAPVLLLSILGLIAAFTPPSVFSLPPSLVGPENASQGFGVLSAAMHLGVLIGPLILGRVLDVSHSDGPIFYTLAGFAVLAAVLCYFLKPVKNKYTVSVENRAKL